MLFQSLRDRSFALKSTILVNTEEGEAGSGVDFSVSVDLWVVFFFISVH